MNQIENFLTLDGYGVFVWPAYGLALLMLAGLFTWTLRELRHNRQALHRLRSQAAKAGPET
ncbi:MAG: heme exporter protein CcmD [Rhodospirillaceae bacterium]|nr:MAG: heme exporter protein CcmD [Rhodospirillaceae bacterium]